MANYFTSDWHLGHVNILKYCSRPFAGVEEMNSAIIAAANDAAGPEDHLWILGDVAMGRAEDSLPLLRQLRAGSVTVIGGNHDRWHPYACGGELSRQVEELSRFRTLTDVPDLRTEAHVEVRGRAFALSHFPYAGDIHDQRDDGVDRFAPWRVLDAGGWLLCGHVHGSWRQKDLMINVGIDAWGGRIVSESDLEALEAPGFLPPIPWV